MNIKLVGEYMARTNEQEKSMIAKTKLKRVAYGLVFVGLIMMILGCVMVIGFSKQNEAIAFVVVGTLLTYFSYVYAKNLMHDLDLLERYDRNR